MANINTETTVEPSSQIFGLEYPAVLSTVRGIGELTCLATAVAETEVLTYLLSFCCTAEFCLVVADNQPTKLLEAITNLSPKRIVAESIGYICLISGGVVGKGSLTRSVIASTIIGKAVGGVGSKLCDVLSALG